MNNKEIEFKYSASNLTLQHFKKFCEAANPKEFKIVSGYDHFYSKSNDTSSFYRHRVNTNENQLTFKRKTVEDNNFIREEHNIDLPLSVVEKNIQGLCNINGYQYNVSIFKNCFIYNYEYYTLVYYICYDIDLVEKNRFFEIEVKEDYEWSNEEEAWQALVTLEKLCKPLGANIEARIKQSLYELNKRS